MRRRCLILLGFCGLLGCMFGLLPFAPRERASRTSPAPGHTPIVHSSPDRHRTQGLEREAVASAPGITAQKPEKQAQLRDEIVLLFEKRQAECAERTLYLCQIETFPEGIPTVVRLLKDGRFVTLCLLWLAFQCTHLADEEVQLLASHFETHHLNALADALLIRGGNCLDPLRRELVRSADRDLAGFLLDEIPNYDGRSLKERLPLYEAALRVVSDDPVRQVASRRLAFLVFKADEVGRDGLPSARIERTLTFWQTTLAGTAAVETQDIEWLEEEIRRAMRLQSDANRIAVRRKLTEMLASEEAGLQREAHIASLGRLSR